MKIKALQAFTMRDAETGDLTSVACGAVEEVSDALGNQLITDGLAEAYTLISPTGTKTITENGTGIDVAQYATADVDVAGYNDFLIPIIDGVTPFPEVLEIPDIVGEIRKYVTQYCSDAGKKNTHKIVVPSSVKKIGDYAFQGFSNVTEISIAEGLTTLGTECFPHTKITEIILPSTLTNLDGRAFIQNTSGLEMTVLATVPPTVSGSLPQYTMGNIYVPAESVDAYKSASGWSVVEDKIYAIPTT